MIEINDVSKWYGDFRVLNKVNETIENGQVVVICGPSGSGKSTILKCLNGLESFQEGDIIVDGLSLKDPSTDLFKLRQKMGMVFQRFELYPHLKVMENISIAPCVSIVVTWRGEEESPPGGLSSRRPRL